MPLPPLRFVYGTDLTGPPPRTFDEVLAAVGSNRLDAEQRPALVVVERAAAGTPSDGAESVGGEAVVPGGEGGDDEDEDECELDMETMQPLDPDKCLQ